MRSLLILICLGFANTLIAQVSVGDIDDISIPIVKFLESEIDFGESMEGETLEHTFKFINEGKDPLVISNVLTSCGCTIVDWTQAPISHGKKGEIKAKFNTTNKIGLQNKKIIILSNSKNFQEELRIKVNVIPRSEAKVINEKKDIAKAP